MLTKHQRHNRNAKIRSRWLKKRPKPPKPSPIYVYLTGKMLQDGKTRREIRLAYETRARIRRSGRGRLEQ